ASPFSGCLECRPRNGSFWGGHSSGCLFNGLALALPSSANFRGKNVGVDDLPPAIGEAISGEA
ncbi:hypothetical protein, partial [Sinorhizobium meliloti]|uniref:hypothetical protein n=1 Tax=Rhizobium meliloti TaxID=382 RepID=UPI003D65CEEA